MILCIIANVYGTFFFTEKSIIYALIKYNKFKKNYTQQIKQISTNSFPIVEKKIRKCTTVLKRSANMNKKEENLFTKAMIHVQFISLWHFCNTAGHYDIKIKCIHVNITVLHEFDPGTLLSLRQNSVNFKQNKSVFSTTHLNKMPTS